MSHVFKLTGEHNNYYRQETQMSHVFKSARKHNNYYRQETQMSHVFKSAGDHTIVGQCLSLEVNLHL